MSLPPMSQCLCLLILPSSLNFYLFLLHLLKVSIGINCSFLHSMVVLSTLSIWSSLIVLEFPHSLRYISQGMVPLMWFYLLDNETKVLTNFQWWMKLEVLLQVNDGCASFWVMNLHCWRKSIMLENRKLNNGCMKFKTRWCDLGNKIILPPNIHISWKNWHHVITLLWREIDLLQPLCFEFNVLWQFMSMCFLILDQKTFISIWSDFGL